MYTEVLGFVDSSVRSDKHVLKASDSCLKLVAIYMSFG
jgi:hypothetical protein